MSAPPKPPADGILTCNVQDVWRLLNTLQETVMRQSTKLKELALKNQGLEHRLQLQDLKLQQQDEKISMLQSQIDNHNATTQEKLITQDEKIKDMKSYAHVLEDGEINVNAYADEAKSTEHVKTNVGTAEQSERVKRSMNVMLRGLPEAEKETIMMLNARMSEFFDEHFGMQDVVVYGAHRVGKKKPKEGRAVVCTLLDARKRSIILQNARFYLKGSPYHIKEDGTPAQQEERRRAYEERKKKETTPSDA